MMVQSICVTITPKNLFPMLHITLFSNKITTAKNKQKSKKPQTKIKQYLHFIIPTLIRSQWSLKCVAIALQADGAFSSAATTGRRGKSEEIQSGIFPICTTVLVINPCSCLWSCSLTTSHRFTLLSSLLSSHGIWSLLCRYQVCFCERSHHPNSPLLPGNYDL